MLLPDLPQGVWAMAWIPFAAALALTLLFSTAYTLYFRSPGYAAGSATVVSVVSLTLTLLASLLTPIDVFLVSYMKFPNGTYQPWAEDASLRRGLQQGMLDAYYLAYALILVLAFFVLPMAFFYHVKGGRGHEDEEEEESESTGTRLCRAVKYTCLSLLIFIALLVVALFLPYGGDGYGQEGKTPPDHLSWWQRAEWQLNQELRPQHLEDMVVFILNVLNVVGMLCLIIYTGYGVASLPIGMIRGRNNVFTQRQNVLDEIENVEVQVRRVEAEARGDRALMHSFQLAHVQRLDQQLRLLRRTLRDLEQNGRSCCNRLLLVLRPFQMLIGLAFAFVALLVIISLLLNSVDKALHSLGPLHGYVLQNGTLPNPVDIFLVFAQDIFPLDYVFYAGLLVFFILCSLSGLQNLGIRVLWVRVYKIRAHRTPPPALLLACLNMVFILLALNVLMFSVVPDYTTYGSQHFRSNVTIGNTTEYMVEKCDYIEAPENDCNMTRIAFLLLAFHSKVWIFGAVYYWLVWLFLVVVFLAGCVTVYKADGPLPSAEEDLEEDEENLLDDTNPFSTS